jgi:hypothetical protein
LPAVALREARGLPTRLIYLALESSGSHVKLGIDWLTCGGYKPDDRYPNVGGNFCRTVTASTNRMKVFATYRILGLGTLLSFFLMGDSFAQGDLFKKHLVYQIESMNSIRPTKVKYRDTLKADIYMPIIKVVTKKSPCVIFVSGFAGINFTQVQLYSDWAKLMAANGIIGIVYETNSPSDDFDRLNEYLTANAKSLHLDKDRIGIWSCSGNSLLAVNKVNESKHYKCHSIYYGLTVTAESKYLKDVEELSRQNGFAYTVNREYTSTTPTLIVRAGKDNWTIILNSIDDFVNVLLRRNIPFEFINYAEGSHSFDMLDDNKTSKQIIVETMEFFKKELIR